MPEGMYSRAFWFCFPFSTISVDLLCIWITASCVQCSVFRVQHKNLRYLDIP